MSAPAAFAADYVDLKFIKSRKVCQIVIEIDIDNANKFVAAFGTPNPATGVPVALARIDPNAKAESVKAEKPKRQWDELTYAEQAGIACNEAKFRRFLAEKGDYPSSGIAVLDSDMAAEEVRTLCGVTTRADLDKLPDAAQKWVRLHNSEYQAWLRAPEVVG